MSTSRLWVTPETELEDMLVREPGATVLSFGSPSRQTEQPSTVPLERFHAFSFNDIAEKREGLVEPRREDVNRLLGVVRECRTDALILQCWFGVSRSTAAALLAGAALTEVAPTELAAALRLAAPWATPNPLMIAHGDAALGLNGALVAAVAAIGRGATTDGGRAFQFSPYP